MRYLGVAFILSNALNVFCEEFLPVVTSCRYWDKLNIYSNVEIGAEVLHCILDQDKVPGIVFTKWTTIPNGMCPIYNRHARQIDGIPCNSRIGDCPTSLVKSYQAVSYTGCFQMSHNVETENCQPVKKCQPVSESNMEPQTDTGKCLAARIHIPLMLVQILAIPVLCTALGICSNRWCTKKDIFHTPKEYAEQENKTNAADSDLKQRESDHLMNDGHNITEYNDENNWSKPSVIHLHDLRNMKPIATHYSSLKAMNCSDRQSHIAEKPPAVKPSVKLTKKGRNKSAEMTY